MTAVQTDTKITNPITDADSNGVVSGGMALSMPRMASWIASYNRNIAPLSEVNQVAIKSAHALVRRQLKMAQEIAGAGIADIRAVAGTRTAWTISGEPGRTDETVVSARCVNRDGVGRSRTGFEPRDRVTHWRASDRADGRNDCMCRDSISGYALARSEWVRFACLVNERTTPVFRVAVVSTKTAAG